MESASTSHKRKKIDEHTKKNKKRQHARDKNVENKMEEKRSGSEDNFGVFEFPWMKESMISNSLDWSLPESLFPVLDDGNEMFEEINDVRWPVKRVSNYRLEFEAFECLWTSISD
ncbi:PREDICTED: uncharacterized protein LOC104787297 [Camelina sativa]|uniref:Uncharacterized protein LOC104787297 n=1 Tax=Camelina sativa TaxID=90675 RepID=A0ABM0Z6K4_CAMSA|nr:PREDICTED: uncharacterized protein LOC104787297 [Camelina sativa]